ncbi:hypothetical protein F5B21DRAFT_504388 [Xylaria acuta]|nr:hypothetical protein F5B21DRAFT_504388 [Xylaria acuta]
MCKIICKVLYSCGHTEPWVQPRACQFDAEGHLKPGAKDPLCLLWGHCWDFGRVREINISDGMLCSACYVDKLKVKITDENVRKKAIEKAKSNAARSSKSARKCTEEAEKRSRLQELPLSYIEKVTGVALKRLDLAFADAQMEAHHFGELLQVVIGLPFLNKDQLVGKFAGKVEENFGPKEVKDFYKLSIKHRNFGDSFRKGLKKPDVLDEPEKSVKPVPTWVPELKTGSFTDTSHGAPAQAWN